MKKATAWLLALVLVVLSVPMCFADVTTDSQTMELKDLNITVDVPAGMYVFTEDTDPVNGDWLLAGYESGFEKLEEFKSICGNFYGAENPKDGCSQIGLRHLSENLKSMLHKCGYGSANKQVPIEGICLNPELSEALLSGYLSGDGNMTGISRTPSGNGNGSPTRKECHSIRVSRKETGHTHHTRPRSQPTTALGNVLERRTPSFRRNP